MDTNELPGRYIIAEGPEGLTKILTDFLEKTKNDPAFVSSDHDVLYQLGSQKSLIKIDFRHKPYQFWYNDILGRPATSAVKEAIASFLWEKCGAKERVLADRERGNE
jgi:hypothetical protein